MNDDISTEITTLKMHISHLEKRLAESMAREHTLIIENKRLVTKALYKKNNKMSIQDIYNQSARDAERERW